MARKLSDVLASGEISVINTASVEVRQNIQYLQATLPQDEDSFLRIGANGLTSLYTAPDTDIIWTNNSTSNVALDNTPNVIVALTLTADITTDDGSFSISGSIDSDENKDADIVMALYIDGSPSGETHGFTIVRSTVNNLFNISGNVLTPVSSGSVVGIAFTSSNQASLRGDVTATVFKVRKAA